MAQVRTAAALGVQSLRIVLMLLLLLRVGTTATATATYPQAGCPAEGCLPSGAFALNSDIPGLTTGVAVKWIVTAASDTVPELSRLGCVTCKNGLVCPTRRGYVSLDYTASGKTLWRYDNLTTPTLPILDLFGDLIGTNGKSLIKIDSDGQVQKPIIHFWIDLAPMYSVQLASDFLLLLVSRTGLLMAYDYNGIPQASLLIRDEIEGVNGTFVPVAQPVIYGNRSYILMQFAPDSPVPDYKANILGLQRLYAIDIFDRLVKCINLVWYVNFEREFCPPHNSRRKQCQPASEMYSSTVLVHRDTVYVSLGRPLADCECTTTAGNKDSAGTLWAFKDLGNTSRLLFKNNCSVSSLSIYDDDDVWEAQHPIEPRGARGRRALMASEAVLWAATEHRITGYSTHNGSVLHEMDVSKLLNVSCRITSKVMVARRADGSSERLVFAVAVAAATTATRQCCASPTHHDGRWDNSSRSLVVAVDASIPGGLQLLWTVPAPAGSTVVGQIANVMLAERAGLGDGRKEGKRKDNLSAEEKPSSNAAKILLVAMAVSDKTEQIFAIGDK